MHDVPATQDLFRSQFNDCTKELTQNIFYGIPKRRNFFP